eukprot:SAG31_NODE_3881_length_3789_cov_2.824390_2_plen_228_part_00
MHLFLVDKLRDAAAHALGDLNRTADWLCASLFLRIDKHGALRRRAQFVLSALRSDDAARSKRCDASDDADEAAALSARTLSSNHLRCQLLRTAPFFIIQPAWASGCSAAASASCCWYLLHCAAAAMGEAQQTLGTAQARSVRRAARGRASAGSRAPAGSCINQVMHQVRCMWQHYLRVGTRLACNHSGVTQDMHPVMACIISRARGSVMAIAVDRSKFSYRTCTATY